MSDVASFELRFCPNVELVSTVRQFVSEFYARVTPDRDGVAKLALAAHELLENAVRYAASQETILTVSVTRADPTRGHISTRNAATAWNVMALKKKIEELHCVEDRESFYQSELHRSLLEGGPGGLGLPRILAEADMILSMSELEGGQVVISAETENWRTA
jgi:hypothetical protein